MQLFQDFLDRSKQLNQTPDALCKLPYHAPKHHYKFIYQGLILPALPAPLHYVNFLGLLGHLNSNMLRTEQMLNGSALDTASIHCSTSPHMVGQTNHYSMQHDCKFSRHNFQFAHKERITGRFPQFRIQRDDSELSFDLQITTSTTISYFTKLRMNLAEHWSLLCQCEGDIRYKDQHFEIQQLGSFEYARSIQFPYLAVAFFCYQVINLENQQQMLLLQSRDVFNRILQSRIYLRDASTRQSTLFDEQVQLHIQRVYPQVTTPIGQTMYLPREFEWTCQDVNGNSIYVKAQSRGDFKFGAAAGYVGSFQYQLSINGNLQQGEAGYCEYIDCRALKWQEQDQAENVPAAVLNPEPFMIKKRNNQDFSGKLHNFDE
ncbi:XapX domain-containing protein [Acinetobacter sp. A1]|uniref:XapX domain-containing protein n=1 Tax=Acinetobacter sp. A1 TaxID=401467 RepID=UPI001444C256|nr:XapX domain-containing protein [Acinetobacter sp. A1]